RSDRIGPDPVDAHIGRRAGQIGAFGNRHDMLACGLKQPLHHHLRHTYIITYIITWPPLADRVEPVISPASSEARNTTQRAISSGSPSRPIGISGRMFFSRTSLGTACTISVLM